MKLQFEILIVDDVEHNLLALKALLSNDGVNVTQAQSGEQALNMMLIQDFDLALLDVQMPEMSGIELAVFMRGTKKTRHIPIIFVTGDEKDHTYDFKGSEHGAVDYLQKPLNINAIISKVKMYHELHLQKK